jgi:hypothetical protein|tara:strand:- start:1083 stop:1613 length:531 start_codon:yes stop_codon:yes gene_type:complete
LVFGCYGLTIQIALLAMNKKTAFKLLSLVVFVLIYFKAVIPFREISMEEVKSKLTETISEEIKIYEQGARGVTVYAVGSPQKYKARIPFGMNFFIGIIGLILISATKKFYYIEIGVQLIFGLIIVLSFLYGVKGNISFLRISDMASVYFLPLSSLFMVVLAFIEKKTIKVKLINES